MDTAGKIGIGTASPAYTLDVNGTGRITTNGTDRVLTISNSAISSITSSSNIGTISLSAAPNPTGESVVSTTYIVGGNWGGGVYGGLKQGAYGFLAFSTIGGSATVATERMRIVDNTGYVGINCNAPAYTLDVNGTISTSSNINVQGGNVVIVGTNTQLDIWNYCTISQNSSNMTVQARYNLTLQSYQCNVIFVTSNQNWIFSNSSNTSNVFTVTSNGNLFNSNATSNQIGGVTLTNQTLFASNVIATKGNAVAITPVSSLALLNGNGSSGSAQIEFQFISGGYTQFISSRHNTASNGVSASNAIDFWLYSNSTGTISNNYSTQPGTGNINMMSVTAAGVGIAKSTPQYLFDVGDSGNTSIRIGPRQFVGTAADTTTYGLERSRHEILFAGYRDAQIDKISSKIVNINKQTYGGSAQQAIQSGDLAFFTSPPGTGGADATVERLRIMDTGNVGIGCNAPSRALDVNGGLQAGAGTNGGNIYLVSGSGAANLNMTEGTVSLNGTGLSYNAFSSGTHSFNVYNSTPTLLSSMTLTSNGLGINCNAPAYRLDVVGQQRVTNPGGNVLIVSNSLALTSNTLTTPNTLSSIVLCNAGTGGTGSTFYNNSILFSTAGYGGCIGGGLQNGVGGFLSLGTMYNNTIIPMLNIVSASTSNGNVGIGTTSPGYTLDVNGSCRIWNGTNGVLATYGATSWATTSDSNLKNVIAPITNATSSFDAVTPVYYSWKSDDSNIQQVGVIAQEIQQVVPEAIGSFSIGSNDYLSVRYTELIPHLIAAVKELSARLSNVEAKAATTGS